MKRTTSIESIFKPLSECNVQSALTNEDFKATNKTLSLWRFISQVIESTYLADNHSKILLIHSESGHKVSIITSQNLTRGNRNESYIITTAPQVFDKFLAEVQNLIKNHSVPLSEILQSKIST